ncbi:hypothetical protein QL285_082999 [Trifolium repens]|nr:hypothetical protein QL285_082999 [Trifolium repens]
MVETKLNPGESKGFVEEMRSRKPSGIRRSDEDQSCSSHHYGAFHAFYFGIYLYRMEKRRGLKLSVGLCYPVIFS